MQVGNKTMNTIKVKNITKRYGDVTALNNISLEIKRKELLHKINISETEITNNFISEKVYKKLMNQ